MVCRASVLALAGSRRAALPGVGGIRPWPFLGGVVNDPFMAHRWGRFPRGGFRITTPTPLPDVASRQFIWQLATSGSCCTNLSPPFPFIPPTTGSSMSSTRGNNETMCLLLGKSGFQVLILGTRGNFISMSFIIRPAKVCYGIGDMNCERGTEDLSDCPCGGQSGTWNQVCSIGFETTKSVL